MAPSTGSSSRRARASLPARLNGRNSRLWCELVVGSLTFRAYLAARDHKSLHELHDGRVGWCDSNTGTILVGWDVPDDIAECTLYHELHHAAIFAYGVQLNPEHDVDEDEEEAIVNPLSAGLYDALKRSGWLNIPPRPRLPAGARSTS